MKRMLFNATHPEELRVAIVDGQKLIDLDIETAGREQRKGNIYKGVITRIEPSLEACFVNYGEDRHGFLPFKEVPRSYFKDGADVRTARIQDVLTVGQDIIVQVEKEERGNKGAALTAFISLAGRYLVLMPNNPRGGGVSRRIEGDERQELRETMEQLDIPTGMSVIARTAGIGRSVEELQWDLAYLLQLWQAIDNAVKENPAPVLIYLESSLVIRALRDYYSNQIGEILIDTDDITEQAQSFMSVVMPDNVHKVKRYHDDVPLFSRFQIERQIETAYARTVPLPSGGAIVIDHTEALVAIDVNSARSTKGSDIEETAMRTNLEAADEVARQLRLRDLGGLIVIDFIDMEDSKNQKAVETRLKDALHYDRARVQMGKISRFGLMELSRQRLRPALSEGSHTTCPRCNGTGVIRDSESSALQVLRLIQEESMKDNTAAIHAQVPVEVATFLLNEKRADIAQLEARLKINVILIPNKFIETPHHILERISHDDPRLDNNVVSYKMVEEPETNLSYQQKEANESKSQNKPLVKTITHTQPAPTPVSKPETAPSKGFFAWIKALFQSPEKVELKTEEQVTEERKTKLKHDRNKRTRNTRGRRNDRHIDDDESKTANAEIAPDTTNKRDNRDNRGRKERRPVAEIAESVTQKDATQVVAKESAEPNKRSRRNPRKERRTDSEVNVDQSNDVTVHNEVKDVQTAPTQVVSPALSNVIEQDYAATSTESENDGERRRRGARRTRRGKRTDESSATTGVAEFVSNEQAIEQTSDQAPIVVKLGDYDTTSKASTHLDNKAESESSTQEVTPITFKLGDETPSLTQEALFTVAPATTTEVVTKVEEMPHTIDMTPIVFSVNDKSEPSTVSFKVEPMHEVAVGQAAATTNSDEQKPIVLDLTTPVDNTVLKFVVSPEPVAVATSIDSQVLEPIAVSDTEEVITTNETPTNAELQVVIESAGLKQIETDSSKFAPVELLYAPPAPTGRAPRVKQVVSESAPLKQVETQSNAS